MANIIEITDLNMPELDVFVRLTGAQLRSKLEPQKGIFIAESPTVIDVALDAGCIPVSILTDNKLINGDVGRIISRCRDIPVYTANGDILAKITGFELTRGALCSFKRPPLPTLDNVLKNAKRIAVLEEITDSTNIGAIFRSAAALNVDAVLITPTCCDPLCRRALRVSMGTALLIPYTKIGESHQDWPYPTIATLKDFGFKICAMALSDKSIRIDDNAILSEEKLAIILGTEGTGLKKETIEASDYTVKIPMSHGVDSLNVGAAAAIAFWQLCKK